MVVVKQSGIKAALFLGMLFSTSGVRADSLADAIVQAYQSNPTLQSQRYDLKALDDAYMRAYAAIRPRGELQFTGEYVDSRAGWATQDLRLAGDPTVGRRLKSNQSDVRIVMEQLLYSGGQAKAGIDSASYRIRSGREGLRITEGDLLLQVIVAYEDIRRDVAGLEVRRANLLTLERQVEMTAARKVAGEVTRTDIEQANVQLSAARAQMAAAEAQLQASRSAYAVLVGAEAPDLEAPSDLPLLPNSLEGAWETAEKNNPEILQAQFNERDTLSSAGAAKAANSMVITGRTTYGATGQLSPFYGRDQDKAFTVSINVTKPLFSGGANAAGYREALNRNAADRLRIDATRRSVTQNVQAAWNQLVTARRNIAYQEQQLKSAEVAAQGMKEEFRYGQRSTLDVLIGEQNLRDAQLALIGSRHDAYIAQATLLRAVGYLEARLLVIGMRPYDTSAYLRSIKSKGAVPWEGAVLGLDSMGYNGARPVSLTPFLESLGDLHIAPAKTNEIDLTLSKSLSNASGGNPSAKSNQ